MNKNIIWLFFILLVAYFALVFCEENSNDEPQNALQAESRDLENEARRRRHKHYHHLWAWHALAIAYWVKVKVIIFSFFVGSALFVGLRYFWPQKCNSNVGHDGPIIYENPHSFEHHHDFVPYHSDHHIDHSSFDPYSAYAGSYSDISDIASTAPDVSGAAITAGGDSGVPHSIRKRSTDVKRRKQQYTQQMPTEEQIANFMFAFLGLDSKACRRRFICEMEFRSKENSLTSLGFRMVGRGFFEKYLNRGKASSFAECAIVNPECVFIEQDDGEQQEEDHVTDDQSSTSENFDSSEFSSDSSHNQDSSQNQNATETNTNTIEDTHQHNPMEEQNAVNLIAEQRHRRANLRRRGIKKSNNYATGRALTQPQNA